MQALRKLRESLHGEWPATACAWVSVGWWLLRLSAKILALLRLSVNFFQLRLTKKLNNNFFCFKDLNINKPVFFVSASRQNLGLRIMWG